MSAELSALYDLKLYKAKALHTLARIYLQRREVEQCRALIRIGQEIANAAEYFSCVKGFRQLEANLEFDLSERADAPLWGDRRAPH